MYNLIEYSDNYPKTSGCLWEDYRDEQAASNNTGNVVKFTDINTTNLFKLKENNNNTNMWWWQKYVEIICWNIIKIYD